MPDTTCAFHQMDKYLLSTFYVLNIKTDTLTYMIPLNPHYYNEEGLVLFSHFIDEESEPKRLRFMPRVHRDRDLNPCLLTFNPVLFPLYHRDSMFIELSLIL